MSQYLLAVVTQSLRGGSPTQSPRFNRASECIRALFEYYIYAWYKSHDDAVVSYSEDALRRFHTFKGIFLLGRAAKMAKVKANALRTEVVKNQNVEEKRNTASWMPCRKRREINAWRGHISYKIDISKELDTDFNFQRSTWCLIGQNTFIDMEPCNSILPRDINKHIKWTSRIVGTPPIKISTTCLKWSTFSVTFSASESESWISKPSLSVGRTVLLPAKSSLPALIWLPPSGPSHMRRTNSWDPNPAVMESILMRWSQTSEYYLTIYHTQCTAWQYTAARGSLSHISVITRCIYQINNCIQLSSVCTLVIRFKLSV